MKKIITLIIISLFLTGCYDNIELDDLSIIGGIGIDYIDNNYYVTYEIYNDNKSQNTQDLLSYTISGKGENISKAIIDANYKTSKTPYYAHMKILILSENIINTHLEDIVDYFFRSTEIRDEFQVVIAKGITPKALLERNSKRHPVVSDLINNLLNLEKYNNNLAINETFKKILSKLISKRNDIILNTISVKEDRISLDNSYIFKGYNYQNVLSEKESILYNMLSKNTINTEFQKKYNDDYFTITINKSKSNIKVLNDKIIINLKLEGKILENNPNFNLKDPQRFNQLNKDFQNLITNDIKDFIKFLQINKSDILGFQNIYYKKYGLDNNNLWTHADIIINTDLKINTKGFIFEVNK
jgi:spore germination protein KC